ncbi:Receptor-like kinase [Quillaja saponaria]|uniref:Receptor-like kinase n=1 Tax=Quillaja saponaria TaxID=32244 RepID=A0AAD7QD71_QUISA|nr:Receptor-like kinase [Quillaja saponaria]
MLLEEICRKKADIYSFGVLVLETISCRRNTDLSLSSEMQYLPEHAWNLYERSKVIDLVDPKMREDGILEKDVMQAINVAFLCSCKFEIPNVNSCSHVTYLRAKLKWLELGTPMRSAFLQQRRKRDEDISWYTLTEAFPSSVPKDSPSIPKIPN